MSCDSRTGRRCGRARRRRALALLLALFAFAPARAETRTDFRILPAYFKGDFGTGIDTEIAYLPFIVTVGTERQEFRLTVPFLSITTSEPVTFAGGEIIARGPSAAAAGSTQQSGPGDVVLQEEYFFVRGGARRPWISGLAMLKLPTADDTKGLGTGEADYGPGVAIIQPVGAHLSLLGEARYIVRGDPPGIDYRNTLWLSAGVQARRSKTSSVSLLYDDRQSVLSGRQNLRDLSLGYDRLLSAGAKLRLALYTGLSRTAEDYGFSAGVSFGRPR